MVLRSTSRRHRRLETAFALLMACAGGAASAAAQAPTSRAELFMADRDGFVYSQSGVMHESGQAQELTPADFSASAFSFVAPPSNPPAQIWVQFPCAAGDEPFIPRRARVLSMSIRTMGAPGHDHGGTPPQGTLSPTTGLTQFDLKFYTEYTAPAVAVNEQITIHYIYEDPNTGCDGYDFFASFVMAVREKGLVQLPVSRFMRADPITYGHASVLYVDPSFGAQVQQMAYHYFQETRRYLRVHTASLPQGGLFDVGGTYSAPFADHRKGTEIDVSGGVTENATDKLIEAGQKAGLACRAEGSRVHCGRP